MENTLFEKVAAALLAVIAWVFLIERHRLTKRLDEHDKFKDAVMRSIRALEASSVTRAEQQHVDDGLRAALADLRKENREDNGKILDAVSELKDTLLKLVIEFGRKTQ